MRRTVVIHSHCLVIIEGKQNTKQYDSLLFSKDFLNGIKALCIPLNLSETDETSINSTQVQYRIFDSMNFTKKSPTTNTIN